MFISDIGLQFSFFVASLSGFGIRMMVASQNELGSLPSSEIFWKFEQDRCQLFSKFLVKFSCQAVWTWAFVCWKISVYSFNFCACDGSVKIFYFFLVQDFKNDFSCLKRKNEKLLVTVNRKSREEEQPFRDFVKKKTMDLSHLQKKNGLSLQKAKRTQEIESLKGIFCVSEITVAAYCDIISVMESTAYSHKYVKLLLILYSQLH